MTFCISTQVGCAMACAFCLTGKMGLVRNLTAGEIVGQVRVLADALDLRDKPFNIVLMGMGEPLHNYDETMKALRILADEHGFALSPRRITLSTVGLLPALERLAHEPLMPNLAISLHAPTDEQRGELVPLNKKYGVADIIDACKRFPLQNAQPDHVRVRAARRRQRLAGGRAPAGEAARGREVEGEPDSAERRARAFRSSGRRTRRSIGSRRSSPITASTVSVRKSRGRDIRAACGQLIVEGPKKSAAQQLAVSRCDVTPARAPTRCARGPAESAPSDSCRSPPAMPSSSVSARCVVPTCESRKRARQPLADVAHAAPALANDRAVHLAAIADGRRPGPIGIREHVQVRQRRRARDSATSCVEVVVGLARESRR